MENNKIKVGIGFATGRKSFRKVLKTYIYNWQESDFTNKENVSLNLFVAYDLKYNNTKSTDYTELGNALFDLIDESYFIGNSTINQEVLELVHNEVITEEEAKILFSNGGYATKRNIILYTAMKQNMDYLVFLDDDEYPMAVTKTSTTAIWSGQQVLSSHLEHIKNADITNGYHCGYISPIPYITFNDILLEDDFKMFIGAISNDIISWDTIKKVMIKGGVTYADTQVLISNQSQEIPEINHAKFISGSNLCINLTKPERVNPFFNPPGARGEDTFLSTCLSDCTVLRVPSYTFHDGFSTYNHLMDGVLPIKLKYIQATDSKDIIYRFYRACIGWIRYKPLFIYITQRENYSKIMQDINMQLDATLPKISEYFKSNEFMNVKKEFEFYKENVTIHYGQFVESKRIWAKIMKYLSK